MYWYLIGLAMAIIVIAQHYYAHPSPQQDNRWRKLPFLAEYLLTHPECKTDNDNNARCYNCESENVLFQPFSHRVDSRYKHICLNCKCTLFRSRSIS